MAAPASGAQGACASGSAFGSMEISDSEWACALVAASVSPAVTGPEADCSAGATSVSAGDGGGDTTSPGSARSSCVPAPEGEASVTTGCSLESAGSDLREPGTDGRACSPASGCPAAGAADADGVWGEGCPRCRPDRRARFFSGLPAAPAPGSREPVFRCVCGCFDFLLEATKEPPRRSYGKGLLPRGRHGCTARSGEAGSPTPCAGATCRQTGPAEGASAEASARC